MSNRKTRKNNKKHKKINIIFDIDETLIQAYNNEGGVLTSFDNGDYAIGKLDSGREYLIYKRPYLDKLMNFCYEYFNVSFCIRLADEKIKGIRVCFNIMGTLLACSDDNN